MQISHSQLRAFHAVAEAGSFTRAAERLCLSQPAVSDQVRKLEEYYGVMVFHRDKRAVRLTEVGERLLGLTRRLFDISIDAHELLMDYRDLTTGSLVLAVDAPVHVLPYVARFCARYPGIDVRIESANTDVVLQRLFSHSADLALLGRSIDDERLHSVPLRRDPMIAFVAKDHPGHDASPFASRTSTARRWCCVSKARSHARPWRKKWRRPASPSARPSR